MELDMKVRKGISELDLNSPVLAEKKSINRFIVTSGLVHIIAAAAIIINNHVPKDETIKESVEIELSSPSDFNSAPEVSPVPEQAAVVQEKAAPAPVAPVFKPIPKQTDSFKQLPPKLVSVEEPKQVAQPSKPLPPTTLDDIETPSLIDTAKDAQATKPSSHLDSQEIEQALDQVDQLHEEQLEVVASQMEAHATQAENSFVESANSAAQHVQEENTAATAQIAARTEALRQEEAAKAAALAEAQAKAADELALQQEKEAAAEKLAAQNTQTGVGQKNVGPGPISEEVRALEQLRQMPGNPKPQYDSRERLKGDQGVVIFQAYVTQDGRLNNFKMLKSTGHRNLDAKTLKALKQWKFYPGQEGWVELPFDWNLKGGPQEMPALLRRKVGQSR